MTKVKVFAKDTHRQTDKAKQDVPEFHSGGGYN